MKTVSIVAFRDESTGTLGLGVKGMQQDYTNNAADALMIAHDLIEHVNGPAQIGSIDDELEALGAIWYVRGQHGDLRRDGGGSLHSTEQHLASDVVRMFRDYAEGGQYVAAEPRSMPHDHDVTFNIVIEYAAQDWRGEVDDIDRCAELWEPWCGIVRARMRIGYRKARRQWERRGRFAANRQFWAIVEAVKPFEKPEMEGQRLTLKYGNGDATCCEDYEEEY